MGSAEVQQQGERLVLISVDEFEGVVGEQVRQRAFERAGLAVLFESRIHRSVAAAEEAEEVMEAVLRRVEARLRAQMPFANKGSAIAVLMEDLRPGRHVGRQAESGRGF